MIDRWKIDLNDMKQLTATPDLNQMSSFIASAVHSLAIKCAKYEEAEIIRCSQTDVLKQLKKAIEDELVLRGAE